MNLEPTTPDPKKLRTTAWTLVVIMIAGGWLVLKAYRIWENKQKNSPLPARIHRIQEERSLRVLRQDGKEEDFISLRGKVWVLHLVSTAQPEDTMLPREEMRRLAAKYANNNGFRLVTLVVDPPEAAKLLETLKQESTSLGATLPQWWVGSNEVPTLHKFIRNELKPSVPPEFMAGKWKFDSSLILIDRDGHLNRPVIQQKRGGPPYIATFDFNEAAAWDARGVKTGTPLTNVEQMRELLDTTIATLLALPAKP